MGELIALASAACFALSNLTISRGVAGSGKENGAFLSIVITALLSALMCALQGAPMIDASFNWTGVLWYLAAGALTMFVGRVFFYASVSSLGPVRASAVKRLNPLFSVFLAVLLLGEQIDHATLIGVLLIASSFALLAYQSLANVDRTESAHTGGSALSTLANLGFAYGPISALAYALGYICRKQGLYHFPEPTFGTLLGAVAGITCFLAAAPFSAMYRRSIRATFTTFNKWLLAAGVLASSGQILYFVALSHSTITRVALISSMEVFLTMGMARLLFREEPVKMSEFAAAAIGFGGSIFIVLR
jgi:drug/metabolite transporter (DMT)-like permease